MYNNERGWVREIINNSPVIKFIAETGSYPLIIAQGFITNRVQQGVGITSDNYIINGTQRAQTLARVESIALQPVKRSVIPTMQFDMADMKLEEDAAKLIQCEVYATEKAMSALAMKMRHHDQSMAASMYDKVKGLWKGHAIPDHFKEKKSYIDGLYHAIVQVTEAQKEEFEKMSQVLIMPTIDIIDNKLEENQLTIRCKDKNITVEQFHAVMDTWVAKKHKASVTYVTYKTAIVTLKSQVDRPVIADLIKDLGTGSKTAKATWKIVPHSDNIPSPQETKLTKATRTIWSKDEKPPETPPPVLHRRYVYIDRPCPELVLKRVAEILGFTLISPAEAAWLDAPLRFIGEWKTLEEAKAMEGAENVQEVELPSGRTIILEVQPPSVTRRV